jgi:hypothetical protein
MTKLPSASSSFRATTGSQALLAQITGPGTYAVVHGQTCKACEANAVYARSLNVGNAWTKSGTYTLTCNGNSVSHYVRSAAVFLEVPRQDINDLTFVAFSTTLQSLADTVVFASPGTRTASVEYAESLWPSASPRAFSDSSQSAFVFYEETVSSSISPEQYVGTVFVSGAFVSYAGDDKFKAGYLGGSFGAAGFGDGAEYSVSLFDTYPNATDYLDATPFHEPQFTITTTANAQTLGQSPGQFVSSNVIISGLSIRAGALDRLASAAAPLPTGATGPADRQLPACDFNGLTLRQNKVERHIFRDSPLFKYDTALELNIKDLTVGSPGGFLVTDLPSAQRQVIEELLTPVGFTRQFGHSHALGSCDFYFSAHNPIKQESGPYTLTHSLSDNRATLPGEWHFSGASQIPAIQSAETGLPFVNGYQVFFNAENEATARRDAIQNGSVWDGSYFAPTVATIHVPKRVQFRAQVFHNTQKTSERAAIVLDYRFTSVVSATFFKYPLQLFSVSLRPPINPNEFSPNGRWLLTADFGYGQTGEEMFTRSYLHEVYGSALFLLTQSQWQEQAMAGQVVEVFDTAQNVKIGIRLVSA